MPKLTVTDTESSAEYSRAYGIDADQLERYKQYRTALLNSDFFKNIKSQYDNDKDSLKQGNNNELDLETLFAIHTVDYRSMVWPNRHYHSWCKISDHDKKNSAVIKGWMDHTRPMIAAWTHDTMAIQNQIQHFNREFGTLTQEIYRTLMTIALELRENAIGPYKAGFWGDSVLNKTINGQSASSVGPTSQFAIYMWLCINGTAQLFNPHFYDDEEWEQKYYIPYLTLLDDLNAIKTDLSEKSQQCNLKLTGAADGTTLKNLALQAKQRRTTYTKTRHPLEAAMTLKERLQCLDEMSILTFIKDTLTIGNDQIAVMQMQNPQLHSRTATINKTVKIDNAVAAMKATHDEIAHEPGQPRQRISDEHTMTASRLRLSDQSSTENSLVRATSSSDMGMLAQQGDDSLLGEIQHNVTAAIKSLQGKGYIADSDDHKLDDLINQSLMSLIELQGLRKAILETDYLLKRLGDSMTLLTNSPFLVNLLSINAKIKCHSEQTLELFKLIRNSLGSKKVTSRSNFKKMSLYKTQVEACLSKIENEVNLINESSKALANAIEKLRQDGEIQFKADVLKSYASLTIIEQQATRNLLERFSPELNNRYTENLREQLERIGVPADIHSADSLVYDQPHDSAAYLTITNREGPPIEPPRTTMGGGSDSGETKSPRSFEHQPTVDLEEELNRFDIGNLPLSRSASTSDAQGLMGTPKSQERRATTSGLGGQSHVVGSDRNESTSEQKSAASHEESSNTTEEERVVPDALHYEINDESIQAGITSLAALYNKKHTKTFATIQKDGRTIANGGVLDEAEIALLLIAKHPELRAPTSVTINELISELKITLIPNKAKSSGPYRIEEIVYGCNDVPFSIRDGLDHQGIANCFYAAKDAGLVENVKAKNKWRWGEGDRITNAGKTAKIIVKQINSQYTIAQKELGSNLPIHLTYALDRKYKPHPIAEAQLISIITHKECDKISKYTEGLKLTAKTQDHRSQDLKKLLSHQPENWNDYALHDKKNYVRKLTILLHYILRGGAHNLKIFTNASSREKMASKLIAWVDNPLTNQLEVLTEVSKLKYPDLGQPLDKLKTAALMHDKTTETQQYKEAQKKYFRLIGDIHDKENSLDDFQFSTSDSKNEDYSSDLHDFFGGNGTKIHTSSQEEIDLSYAVTMATCSSKPEHHRIARLIGITAAQAKGTYADKILLLNSLNVDNIKLNELKIDSKLKGFKILYDFLKDPTNSQLSGKIGARELADFYGIIDIYGLLSNQQVNEIVITANQDIHNIASIVTGIMRDDRFRNHINTIQGTINRYLTLKSLYTIAMLYSEARAEARGKDASFEFPTRDQIAKKLTDNPGEADSMTSAISNDLDIEALILRAITTCIAEQKNQSEKDKVQGQLARLGIDTTILDSINPHDIPVLNRELSCIDSNASEQNNEMITLLKQATVLSMPSSDGTSTSRLTEEIQLAKTIAQREDASDDDKKAASLLLFSAMKEHIPSNVAASDEDTHDQSGQTESKQGEGEDEVTAQDDVAQPTSASVTAASLDILQKRLQSKYEEAQHRNQARLSHPEEKEGDNDIESTDSIHAAFSESQNQIAQWKDFLKQEYGEAINDANSQLNSADQLIEDALRSYTSSLDDDNSSLPTLTGTLKANKQQVINLFAKGNIDQYFEKCHDRGFTLSNGLKKRIKQLAYQCSSNRFAIFSKSATNRLLRASKILVLIGFIEKSILEKTERIIKYPNDQTSVQDIFHDLICTLDNENNTSGELQAAHAILDRTRGRYFNDSTGARSRSMISGLRAQANEYRGQKQQSEQLQKSLAEESKIRFFSPQTAPSRINSSENISSGFNEHTALGSGNIASIDSAHRGDDARRNTGVSEEQNAPIQVI
jgi:hypothetical protein